jgi:hypothetical protein
VWLDHLAVSRVDEPSLSVSDGITGGTTCALTLIAAHQRHRLHGMRRDGLVNLPSGCASGKSQRLHVQREHSEQVPMYP